MSFSDLVALCPYACHESLSVFAVVGFLIKLSAVANWAILRSECKLFMF